MAAPRILSERDLTISRDGKSRAIKIKEADSIFWIGTPEDAPSICRQLTKEQADEVRRIAAEIEAENTDKGPAP